MGSAQKGPGGVLGALRALDAFPKVNEDFFQKTMSGGIITMVAYAFMLLLFLSETREWRRRQRAGAGRRRAARRALLRGTAVAAACVSAPAALLTAAPRAAPPHPITGLYLAVHRSHELVVDSSRGETISIDVSKGAGVCFCCSGGAAGTHSRGNSCTSAVNMRRSGRRHAPAAGTHAALQRPMRPPQRPHAVAGGP